MIKKYNPKDNTFVEVDRGTLKAGELETIQARTRAFIQLCRFNRCIPEKMASALLSSRNMSFLSNCSMTVDTEERCRGVAKFGPYSYSWKDEYMELVNMCRKLYWKKIDRENIA